MARLLLAFAAVALLVAGHSVTMAEEAASPTSTSAQTTRVAPAAPDIDLRRVRNIFRYGDAPRVADGPARTPDRPPVAGPAEVPAPESRTRLVGLVQRGGRRAAALSIDGEVVVLGEGDSSGGFTVAVVDDEAVTLRGPEGGEEILPLP
jgi:hypothetical protein